MSEFFDRKGQSMALEDWASSFEKGDNGVAHDTVGDVRISTVWLGANHQWGDGPPLIYETMIFGGDHDQDSDRYSTEEEALEGHRKAVALVKGAVV